MSRTESFKRLAAALGDQAVTAFRSGELNKGFEFSIEAERICRQIGDSDQLQAVLNNYAIGLEKEGRWAEAFQKREEELSICRQLADPENLDIALEGYASACLSLGNAASDERDHTTALAWYERADPILRERGDANNLALCLNSRSRTMLASGRNIREALELAQEGADICRRVGIQIGLAACLFSQAQAQQMLGNEDAALSVLEQAQALASRIGYGGSRPR